MLVLHRYAKPTRIRIWHLYSLQSWIFFRNWTSQNFLLSVYAVCCDNVDVTYMSCPMHPWTQSCYESCQFRLILRLACDLTSTDVHTAKYTRRSCFIEENHLNNCFFPKAEALTPRLQQAGRTSPTEPLRSAVDEIYMCSGSPTWVVPGFEKVRIPCNSPSPHKL